MSQKISLIIPTKNEQRNIGRCLSSITSNGYKNYEIIVVDQASTDETVAIAHKFKAQVINVPPSHAYIPPSQSRNLGFTHSRGEIIYHLDADMELEPGLLAEISQLLSDPGISAVVIPETDAPANFWAQGKALERSFYKHTDMEAARATTRDIFSSVMYAPEITSGEDWFIHDQYQSLGRIGRTTRSVLHHTGSISLLREFKKKLHYGSSSENYLSQNSAHIRHKFITLLWLYVKGILGHVFLAPAAVLAFIVVRLVDASALFLGLFLRKLK